MAIVIVAVLGSGLFCTWAGVRLVEILGPIDASVLKLNGGATIRWNGIEFEGATAGLMDMRPAEMAIEGGFLVSYDLLIRRLTGIDVIAVLANGSRQLLVRLAPSSFWPHAGRIVDRLPVTLSVRVGPGSHTELDIQGKIVVIRDEAPPVGVELVFTDDSLTLLDARLSTIGNGTGVDSESDKLIHSLRSVDQKKTVIPVVFTFLILMTFTFHAVEWRHERADWLCVFATYTGLVLAVLSRRPLAGNFLLALFLGVYLISVRTAQRRVGARLSIPLALGAVALATIFVQARLIPPAATWFLLTMVLLLALREVMAVRESLPWSQAISLGLVLAAAVSMELAARATFPDGRILRGMSETQFWAMPPGGSTSYLQADGGVLLQGKVLKNKPLRDHPAVVLLGGSVIFASEVDPDANPAALLQERLGERADVFNGGLVGAPSYTITRNFVQDIAPRQPEIVLAYLLHNDIFQAGPLTLRDMETRRRAVQQTRGILGRLVSYRYVAEKIARLKGRAAMGRCSDDDIIRTLRLDLNDLADAAARYGVKLILVPEETRLNTDLAPLARKLREVVLSMRASTGVTVGEVCIPDRDPGGFRNFDDTVHLTRTGYQYLVRGLEQYILVALNGTTRIAENIDE